MNGTIQLRLAELEMFYSRTTGRCVCGDTITLRIDGFWYHAHGTYCRDTR